MNNKYPTITIGIPAHNEAQTIGDLIHALLRQKGQFIIEAIYIICDGCTDKTENIAKGIDDTRVHIYNDGQRKGKAHRLNQIYQKNTSDYLATFDGDVLLKTDDELALLLQEIQRKKNTKVVAGNIHLINAKSGWVEQLLYYNHMLWAVTTQTYKNGNNIHTSHGAAYLFKKDFAKRIVFPKNITCDQGFIYILAQPDGYTFAHKTRIVCNPASKLSEIQVGYNRTMEERADVVTHFGKSALKHFDIPVVDRIKGIIRFFYIHPGFTVAAVLFNVWIKFSAKTDTARQNGLWSITKSAKRKIILTHIS